MRIKSLGAGFIALVFLFAPWPNGAGAAPKRYSLFNSFTHVLHSQQTGGDYNVYVALPRGYDASTRYPAMLLQDGDYSFPLAQSIVLHFTDRHDIQPVIVVGIAYHSGIDDLKIYRLNRTRDFTPSFTLEGGYGPEFQRVSGGAKNYAAFIAKELKPFLERKYRINPADWTYVGHSYGGLFGAFLLMTEPDLFHRYILVSPSLWYDDGIIFRGFAVVPPMPNPPPRIFLAVGASENPEMASDLLVFGRLLREGFGSDATVTTTIFPDEIHDSVFPAALTRGLRVIFNGDARVGGADMQ